MSWFTALIACWLIPATSAQRPDDSHWIKCYDCNTRNVVGQNQAGKVGVWDARTGKFLFIMKGAQEPVVLARLVPDGKHVLGQSFIFDWKERQRSKAHDQLVEWDIRTGKIVWSVQDCIFCRLNNDGKKIFAFHEATPPGQRGRVVCLDVRTGQNLLTVLNIRPLWATNIIEESKNGKELLYSATGEITAVGLTSGRKLAEVGAGSVTHWQPATFLGNGDEFFYASDNVNLYSISKGKVIRKIKFPPNDGLGCIGWLTRERGFVGFGYGGHLMSYTPRDGLVDHGKYEQSPYKVLVSRNEQQFAACWDPGLIPDTQGVICYDTKTCKKLWERSGSGVKILRNGQLVLENGDKISFVNIVTGSTVRSIHLQNFFAKKS